MSVPLAPQQDRSPPRRWAFVRPGEPELEATVDLGALAEALMALSSTVALDVEGVWLEVGGSAHLFADGERAVASRALEIARALGLEAKVAVADRPATARVLARTAPAPLTVVPEGGDSAALAPLPLDVVGASPLVIAYLDKLGVRAVGALRRFSPLAIGRRVGPEGAELVRLARAEPMPPPRRYEPPEQPVARLELDPPLPPGEPLLFVIKRLLDELEARLAGRGLAVAALRLTLTLEGGAKRIEELLLPRPMRSARQLLSILRERLFDRHEDLVAAEPFEVACESRVVAVESRVLRAVPAQAAQAALLDRRREAAEEELPSLLARLAATLGPAAVRAAELVPTHRPEVAFRPAELAAVVPRGSGAARASRRRSMQAHELSVSDPVALLEVEEPPSPRPLFLLPEPLLIEEGGELEPGSALAWEGDGGVVLRAWGPERLRGEWWTDRPFARDYYVVDLEDGERIWIFHDGVDGRLYVHGIFD